MAENESGVTRRGFLKLAGVSGGAAAAASVVGLAPNANKAEVGKFADPAGRPSRPWWVRTVDEPTIEIDWDKMQRYNERYVPELGKGSVRGGGFAAYVGADKAAELQKAGDEKTKQRGLNNEPGYTVKDRALYSAHGGRSPQSFLGNQNVKTPADMGLPNWTGTPEEAAKMLRAALRHFGAGTVGFVELNEKTRKLIYSIDPDGHELVFADVDEPQETDTQRIIPNSYKWVIVWTLQMSGETLKRAPTPLGAQRTA
jgi:epoxyqueuosine reductase